MNHIALSVVLALVAGTQFVAAQGTAFTYQGRLTDAGAPPTGVYDLQFSIWDAASGPNLVGSILEVNDVGVVNGLFVVPLDFGLGVFAGAARWLQIGVRPGNSSGAYTVLTPRTPLRPSPYAIHAGTASSATAANSVPWAGVSGVPAGFADGVDANTVYTAGTGLSLSGTTFSLNTTYADTQFVNTAGDTMSGDLVVPNIGVGNTATVGILRSPGPASLLVWGADVLMTIDKENSASEHFFEVFNGAGDPLFWISEQGNTRIYGDQAVDGNMVATSFRGNGLALTSAGLVKTTVLDVSCVSVPAFSTNYVKLTDIGVFTKQLAVSTIEITFNGRIGADSLAANGAVFEVRIDNTATTNGRARASIKQAEAGGTIGVFASITGIFTGLASGQHTVSVWVRSFTGSGTFARLDPGCWSTDHIVLKELK